MFDELGYVTQTPTITEVNNYVSEEDKVEHGVVKINTSIDVRVIHIVAKLGDVVLSNAYVTTSGYDANGELSKSDLALEKTVRKKIESKLWTSDMSNIQKLKEMASYISNTTIYSSNSKTKEENPGFYKRWEIKGTDKVIKALSVADPVLSRLSILRGGQTTCYAAGYIGTIAIEDLGLRDLYNKEENRIETGCGEGVWIGRKNYSSNPAALDHMTCWYVNSDGSTQAVDAQGFIIGTWENLHCADKIISLR